MRTEWLVEGHEWLRIADPGWSDPLDASFAGAVGGRWNPPDSFPVLYLNEDVVTARLNLGAFTASWPYEAEDLRNETGPMLVGARLPTKQQVVDVHTPAGVRAVALAATYPLDASGRTVPHEVCQPIGAGVKKQGYRGVRCRSARVPIGAGRELAWYPAGTRSVARLTMIVQFGEWYWG